MDELELIHTRQEPPVLFRVGDETVEAKPIEE